MMNSINLSTFNKLNLYNNFNNPQTIYSNNQTPTLHMLKTDTVSFGNNNPVTETQTAKEKSELFSARKKLIAHANDLLKNELKLKPNQPLKITADKKFLPFVEILQDQAYKMSSGLVVIDIKDQKLEDIYKKYNKFPNDEWKKARDKDLQQQGVASIEFKKKNSPFKLAGLTDAEINVVTNCRKVDIPKDVAKKLELDPKEVLVDMLGMKKGQPVFIKAEREHEPNVYKLTEYALKNGYGPVDVIFNEPKSRLTKGFLKHAKSEELLTNCPQYEVERYQKYLNSETARLVLYGNDPNALAGVNSDKTSKNSAAISKALTPITTKMLENNQWTILYAPTTMSSLAAYPKIKDPIKALEAAANDLPEILNKGHFKEYADELERKSKILTDSKFDEIHFLSVDPITKQPDGKTNLYVGLSPKAKFCSVYGETPDGQKYAANVPVGEVFSVPDKTKTHGCVTATMPLSLNGKLIPEGFKLEFEDGKIAREKDGQLKISVGTPITKPENKEEEAKLRAEQEKGVKSLKSYIESNLKKEQEAGLEGSDMLGEVAHVADSPIRRIIDKKGEPFNNLLIDEKAACHIAIGRGYSSCIEGYGELKDEDKKKALLEECNVNSKALIHTDFMIGGPNVIVEGIKKDGTKVTLIENDKFQI